MRLLLIFSSFAGFIKRTYEVSFLRTASTFGEYVAGPGTYLEMYSISVNASPSSAALIKNQKI